MPARAAMRMDLEYIFSIEKKLARVESWFFEVKMKAKD